MRGTSITQVLGEIKDILKTHSVAPSSSISAGQTGSTHLSPQHSAGRGRRIASLRAAWNAEQDCVPKQTNRLCRKINN